jgi:uncharacterized damage-inducible protein DinB
MTVLLEQAEDDFDGRSFNGAPLIETLESLTAAQASTRDTWEGYSVWEVAHHVTYFKYFVARSLGAAAPLEPYPYPQVDFAPAPPEPDDEKWRATIAYLKRVHEVCMAAIRGLSDDRLEARMTEWKATYRRAIAWLCTHDAYHTAQIRSMGVAGLKESKHA